MQSRNVLLFSSLLLFQSCELLEKADENEESNQSSVQPSEKPEELTKLDPEKPVTEKAPVSPPPKPLPKKVEPQKVEKTKEPSLPEKAAFTPELLKAVKNWNFIPKSVFPLSSVTIKKDLKFVAYSQSGQPIGSSMMPAGREVIAIGHKGNLLTVSPSKRGTMRASIAMDETDFKDGVAYLFELRKMQRAAYAERQAKESQSIASKSTNLAKAKPSNKAKPKAKPSNSLFEDLPSPGDYGHGKFCICSDCRTKRLAQTGSMK